MSNHLILKLFKSGHYVGVEKRSPGPYGKIVIFHKNASDSEDTRREWLLVETSRIDYDSFDIEKVDTV